MNGRVDTSIPGISINGPSGPVPWGFNIVFMCSHKLNTARGNVWIEHTESSYKILFQSWTCGNKSPTSTCLKINANSYETGHSSDASNILLEKSFNENEAVQFFLYNLKL